MTMRLKRLRIEQLRQFRQPFEITGFEPGINLFTGPNEAGKSSIVRAIRAAFFERHRSTMVEDLRPWGDSAASPTVELEFQVGETPYHLSKTFLQRKRCELRAGTARLEGAEAEDHLAALLGFQFALKGASKAEYWGIPGLLWIEQGSAQEVHDAVRHATGHLRTALQASLGEVAGSGGDDVLERVRGERELLLTPTGKPRGDYAEAIERRTRLAEALTALDLQIETYRQQVDTLSRLREEQVRDEAERPWETYQAERQKAQLALDAAAQLEQQLAQDRERLRQNELRAELLRQRLLHFEQQQAQLAAREQQLAAAAQALALARERELLQRRQGEAAAQRFDAAREAWRLARQEDSRAAAQREHAEAGQRAAATHEALTQAEAAQTRLQALRQQALASRIEATDLETLRRQQGRLHELQVRQEAAATRLRYELEPGQGLQIDGESVQGQGERLLLAPAELWLPGVGRLHIAPGGSDLGELARQQAETADAHRALLQRLGLESLTDAERRRQAHQEQLSAIELAEAALKAHAPRGLDVLRTEHAAQAVRAAEAKQALERLPPPPDTPAPPLARAEDELEQVRKALDRCRSDAGLALQALAAASAAHEAASSERDLLKASLQDASRRQELQQTEKDLTDTRAECGALGTSIEVRSAQLAAARPDILRQDIERLGRSAEQADKQFRERRDEIIRLESALQVAGGQGLEEQRAEVARQVAQLERRHAELQRRALALDHLLERLTAGRGALTRRLQAPLQKHLDRYLHLLFPQASVQIDEQLTPGPLTRPGQRGPETGEFASLSYGAREQMGVISRLAY
ncbi:AAA family ATPase, partial [Aquabacterium sp. A7-Y]|uniref:AAA family ATPase n=1 Tax=Aquabacterium sp. A7-Y TaxID=1349605 RepID=UPI00223DADEE